VISQPQGVQGTNPQRKDPVSNHLEHGMDVKRLKIQSLMMPNLKAKCAELKGFICDCSDSRQADTFTKTTSLRKYPYAGRTYKYGNDTKRAIEALTTRTIKLPPPPSSNADASEKRVWEKKIDSHVKKEELLEENLKTIYSVIWGQCINVIQAIIEALNEHKDMQDKGDSIVLLKAINALVYNLQSQKYQALAIHDAMLRFYMIYQEK
jgi:hypothetical protein